MINFVKKSGMEIVNPLAQNEGIECGAVVFFMALITPCHLHSFHDRVCLHKESFGTVCFFLFHRDFYFIFNLKKY